MSTCLTILSKEKYIMIERNFVIRMLLSSTIWIITCFGQILFAQQDSIELYTTNTKISISPGKSVKYSIDVINHGKNTEFCNLTVSGIPKSWKYSLKSGTYEVKQIALQHKGKKTITLSVDAPLKVNKGNYHVYVKAGNAKLPLIINISKQGNYQTEFTTEQANMEGHSDSDFSFRCVLKNRTAEKQLYSLKSNKSLGWQVTFKPNRKQATSVEIEPNASKDITIEVKPPENVKTGTYKIPVKAVTNLTSAQLELEVVITGTLGLELITPTGLVSTKITTGGEKKLDLVVKNTGSEALSNVKLSSGNPSGWDVTFEPKEIKTIQPGSNARVIAAVQADKDAIAGDYILNIKAKVPETSSKLAFRVSVKTPLIWGWIGILIIIIALGSIVFLFRKYGRR